ncbi:MAG: amino acid adenylation domain-containing protein [Tatlockia sp.]|jgi:amino acid adenylation domain-containing protein
MAHYFIQQGIKPRDFIAICLNRSVELIIALIAVLKTGATYLPLDTNHPELRLELMISETKAALIVTQEMHKMLFSGFPDSPLMLVDNPSLALAYYSTEPPQQLLDPEAPAYIIYTSGSTGQPKGVLVSHRGLVNLLLSMQDILGIKPDDKAAAAATVCFDMSVFEIFLPLSAGAQLCFSVDGLLTAGVDWLIKNQINFAIATPLTWNTLLDGFEGRLPHLTLLFGGEKLTEEASQKILAVTNKAYHLYGPTEATVLVTCNLLTEKDLTIGTPIANTQVYILNEQGAPVDIGVPGELYIGGKGLALGYLNRPEITKECFIKNPFAKDPKALMYKTGDLCRYLENGKIEYIGRVDFQIKMRGFRIELGEIEYALQQHPDIKTAVVLAREDNPSISRIYFHSEKRLIAYLVVQGKQAIDTDALPLFLKKYLPDYMIPATFVFLDKIPLNFNGKIDRKALPIPLFRARQAYVAPQDALEHTLCAVFKEVLQVDRVGIYDNFRELGINSITLLTLVAKLKNATHIPLSITNILPYQTIHDVSQGLKKLVENPYLTKVIKPLNVKNKHLPIMFFIHPALAGIEVFQHLANQLESNYQSIGIDNFNKFQHNKKIKNLYDVADYYIKQIEADFRVSDNINLFGWSLGGQIAIKMAYLLEDRGLNKINVFLLNTLVANEDYLKVESDYIDGYQQKMQAYYSGGKVHVNDFRLAEEIANAELDIGNELFKKKLQKTEIKLFKAMKSADQLNVLDNYILNIPDNNIQSITENPIRVFPIESDHLNIIENTAPIINGILS